MNLQEQEAFHSEENARWDRIAELKEEMFDYGDPPQPIDMEAWRASIAAREPKANQIAAIYDDQGEIKY